MTDFVQKLNYRRALQGELARTIAQLAEVERARVHLVVPERSLFADQRDRPRASVVLTLRAGKTLAAGQIQGIAHLVASSVEGLQPQEVTVVDSHGLILSSPTGDLAAQQSGAYGDSTVLRGPFTPARLTAPVRRPMAACAASAGNSTSAIVPWPWRCANARLRAQITRMASGSVSAPARYAWR